MGIKNFDRLNDLGNKGVAVADNELLPSNQMVHSFISFLAALFPFSTAPTLSPSLASLSALPLPLLPPS